MRWLRKTRSGGGAWFAAVNHRTQKVYGGDLADEFTGRGRNGVAPELGVKIKSGEGFNGIDGEAAADAHQSGLGNLAADQLLGQRCPLDARDPADVSSAGLGRNTMKPALERLGW